MLIKGYPKGSDITLINTMYLRPHKDEEGNKVPDELVIVYRDNVTAEKKVERIKEPTYQFYKTKEGCDPGYNQLFIEKEYTDMVEVPYASLLKGIAEEEGKLNEFYNNIRNGAAYQNNKLHCNTDIFMSDVNIEDHYRFRFSQEYTNNIFKLKKAYLDIEVDTINMKGDWVEPGECPINCVSLLDENSKKCYTFILRDLNNPLIEEFEMLLTNPERNIFKELKDFVIDAVGGWKKATRFGLIDFDYELFFFDDEIDLIRAIFYYLRLLDPDFWMIWNASFDMPYIIARITELGYDPADIICDKDMPQVARYYVDERNYNEFEARGDFATIGIKPVLLDDMIQFASRRKGKGVYPSYKLDEIGMIVANVRKLDYSHITNNIAELPYLDFYIFIFYNVMDVVVQYCIEHKAQDVDYIFSKCLINNTRYQKGHRQTVYLINRMAKEFFKEGYIIGNNVNKWNDKPTTKFPGALVGDPKNNNDYCKLLINGVAINVARNLIDFDYKSLYPSIMIEDNIAPNTQIGIIKIPYKVYENENTYNAENYSRAGEYIENLTSQNHLEFCHRYFGLASFKEFLEDMDELANKGYFYQNIKPVNEDGLNNPFINLMGDRLNRGIYEINNALNRGIIFYEDRHDLEIYREDLYKEQEEKERKLKIDYEY